MVAMRFPLTNEMLDEKIREIQPLKVGFDNLKIHTIITDENANILYANKAVEAQTGWKGEDIIGKNPGDLWGGRMSQSYYENMWRTIKYEKEPFVGEVENLKREGKTYWQELIISPILDKDNQVRFFIAVEPDVTERKQLEKFRNEFVSALAHQLNSPLSSIRWAVELLREQSGLSDAQKQELEKIYKNDLMLIDVISDLLVVARIGELIERTEIIDLSAELKNIVEQMRPTYPKITFSFATDGPCPVSVTTKSLPLQVFLNLIQNAAHYSAAEGGWAKVVMKHADGRCLISVENNGATINPDEKHLVFTKLYRGNNAIARNIPGTGLGLYICKLICDTFGWTIDFQSPTSQGTTMFNVLVPTTENPAR